MKLSRKLFAIVLVLSLIGQSQSWAVERSTEEKLAWLQSKIETSANDAKTGRYILGGVSVVGGGVLIGMGASLASNNVVFFDDVGALYLIFGGLFVGGGVAYLLTPTEMEMTWTRFQSLSAENSKKRELTVSWAESRLEALSERARMERKLGAFALGGMGVGSLLASSLTKNTDHRSTYLAVGLVSLAFVPLAIFLRDPAEKTWESYQNWKDGGAVGSASSGVEISAGPSVVGEGLGLVAQLKF